MVTRKQMIQAALAGDFVIFPWQPIKGQKMDLQSLIAETISALYMKDAAALLLYITGVKRGTPPPLNTNEQLFYKAVRMGLVNPSL